MTGRDVSPLLNYQTKYSHTCKHLISYFCLLVQGIHIEMTTPITPCSEYAKFAGLAAYVWRILKMSGEGVWSRRTKCPARVFQGQCLANRCPAKSLVFAGHFTVICPAKDWRFAGQNVRRGSNEFRILCHVCFPGVCVNIPYSYYLLKLLPRTVPHLAN